MKKIFYRQCELQKVNRKTTSWIPEKFSTVGKYLRLKDSDGWKVIKVSQQRFEENYVVERSQDFKNTRKASDK